ncbi:alpha/beta hydrolase [Lyngbya sp. PCC 8106]|uniref:alpha/beta hydrolase n=1 Tax=Lyngbya sp. (strain PCC 8106) TaxID=313612 RepID=UPI0000EAA585|nr:alpha/beta hydrolase [Lyngbya sp. PCC 8106]EAW35368.1 probable lipase/esterase [Lyngbya sp. PCC 8106]
MFNALSRAIAYTLIFLLAFLLLIERVWGKRPGSPLKMTKLLHQYNTHLDINYFTVDGYRLQLDVYQRKTSQSNPTLIFIHGGGWVGGEKRLQVRKLIPYLEMGLSVVNIEYRLANIAHSPAAVEDCLCALRWVICHAEKYNFDPDKIILAGESAGGHLALTTGLIPASTEWNLPSAGEEKLKVAAIINWYGITDVQDLITGSNTREYAVTWLGNQPDKLKIADRVSPLNYIQPNLPPILTIHGDADPIVPYSHAVRLHQALDQVEVNNQLLTIPQGGHGQFNASEEQKINQTIQNFLRQYQLLN